MSSAAFIIIRIISNPLSNVFQKQLAHRNVDPALILAVTHALLALGTMPCLALGLVDWRQPTGFWVNLVPCAVLAITSNLLLVQALRSTDLSILGPLNAYKSIISLVLGIFLVGESPSAAGLWGILLIVAGSACIIDREAGQAHGAAVLGFLRNRGVQLRLAALILSATEAVFLKRALFHASPVTVFLGWAQLCFPLAVSTVLIIHRKDLRGIVARVYPIIPSFLALTLTTCLMQLTSILTFARMQVGYSLALFQLSALLSVLLGHHFFEEGNIQKRLIGATIMVLGAALIVIQH